MPSGPHLMQDGESVASIAANEGLLPDTIWNDAKNADLRKSRTDRYSLFDGTDELYVPDKQPKTLNVPVDKRSIFRRKGIPEIFRLRLTDWDGKPRAGLKYLLEIDGCAAVSGVTKGDGGIVQPVPPSVSKGRLKIRNEWDEEEIYTLRISCLDPYNTLPGAQQRLFNLGFDCGAEYGRYGPMTETALLAFQRQQKLQETGNPDDATFERLRELHGY